MSGQYNPRVTPWTIRESAFPAQGDAAAQANFLLNYAILAPSGHNTQPWKFRAGAGSPCVTAYADYSRRLRVVDPDDRELLMTIGAALFNLRVAAAHFGRSCVVEPAAEPRRPRAALTAAEPVAALSLVGGQPDPALAALFPAITQRRTNRAPYAARPLAPAVAGQIRALAGAAGPGVGLCLVEEIAQKARVADLVAEGDRRQMANPAFRAELAGWVRPNSAGAGDGVAGDGLGIPDLVSWGGSWFIRSLDLSAFQARRDLTQTLEAPALAVIYGPDSQSGLLAAGEFLERLLLTLTGLGLQHAYLNQPIQVTALRGEYGRALDLPQAPQVMLRLGYGPSLMRAMPRRPLAQVLF